MDFEMSVSCELTVIADSKVIIKKSCTNMKNKQKKNENEWLEELEEFPDAATEIKIGKKRTWTDVIIPKPKTLKTRAFEYTISPSENPVKLGFISPLTELTSKNMDALKEAILKTMLSSSSNETKPQFHKFVSKLYFWVLVCADNNAANWVRENISKIRTNCRFDVELLEEKQFPSNYLICGHFPNSMEFSNSDILRYIGIQNEVVTEGWKIVHRSVDRDNVQLDLMVDNASLEQLKLKNLKIWFCFGNIQLSLKKKKSELKEINKEEEIPWNAEEILWNALENVDGNERE